MGCGWQHGEITTIGRAGECAGRAHKWPRDHPAHLVLAAQDGAGRFANFVQFIKRNDLFVGRDLEDAVGRRVDDGLAGRHLFSAQFIEDDGPRGRDITQPAAACFRLILGHDLVGEAVGIDREGAVHVDAHQLPMAGRGVLAGGDLGHLAVGGSGVRLGLDSVQNGDVGQSQGLQIGQMQPADGLRNVAQRVAADIAVGRGIRRFADADAVQNDNDDSLNLHSFPSNQTAVSRAISIMVCRAVSRSTDEMASSRTRLSLTVRIESALTPNLAASV